MITTLATWPLSQAIDTWLSYEIIGKSVNSDILVWLNNYCCVCFAVEMMSFQVLLICSQSQLLFSI